MFKGFLVLVDKGFEIAKCCAWIRIRLLRKVSKIRNLQEKETIQTIKISLKRN